jgi:hypothetical protein
VGQSCLLFFSRLHSSLESRGNQSQSQAPGHRDPPGLFNLTGPGPGPKKKSDFGLSGDPMPPGLLLLEQNEPPSLFSLSLLILVIRRYTDTDTDTDTD